MALAPTVSLFKMLKASVSDPLSFPKHLGSVQMWQLCGTNLLVDKHMAQIPLIKVCKVVIEVISVIPIGKVRGKLCYSDLETV